MNRRLKRDQIVGVVLVLAAFWLMQFLIGDSGRLISVSANSETITER
jgi:hypothetical protein